MSWNIRHGGGRRLSTIAEAVAHRDADLVALSEFRRSSHSLLPMLAKMGYQYFQIASADDVQNGLCIASRRPLTRRPACPVPQDCSSRWLDLNLEHSGFGIRVVHVPVGTVTGTRQSPKSRFWDAMIAAARSRVSEPFLFIGDLNTGLRRIDETGSTFICADRLAALTECGWTDVWRAFNNETEYSWYSRRRGGLHGNGFRIDHAFATPALMKRIVGCRYSHAERESGASDHSILIVELE